MPDIDIDFLDRERALELFDHVVASRIEDSNLFIKEVFVDQSKTLKRIQPAPQGRAYRVRKRSNHVTVVLGSSLKNNIELVETETESK